MARAARPTHGMGPNHNPHTEHWQPEWVCLRCNTMVQLDHALPSESPGCLPRLCRRTVSTFCPWHRNQASLSQKPILPTNASPKKLRSHPQAMVRATRQERARAKENPSPRKTGVGQMSPVTWWGKLWKHQVERAFAGLTTFRQDAMMPATVGNANMVSTCAPNQGARKRTAFRIILDSHHKPKLPVHSHLFTKSCQPIEFSQALVA